MTKYNLYLHYYAETVLLYSLHLLTYNYKDRTGSLICQLYPFRRSNLDWYSVNFMWRFRETGAGMR